jgi:hypothetical protein
MAKYIGKDFESGDGEGDSYRSSGRDLPPPDVIRVLSASGSDAVARLLDELAGRLDGLVEYHHCVLDSGGHFVSIYQK